MRFLQSVEGPAGLIESSHSAFAIPIELTYIYIYSYEKKNSLWIWRIKNLLLLFFFWSLFFSFLFLTQKPSFESKTLYDIFLGRHVQCTNTDHPFGPLKLTWFAFDLMPNFFPICKWVPSNLIFQTTNRKRQKQPML